MAVNVGGLKVIIVESAQLPTGNQPVRRREESASLSPPWPHVAIIGTWGRRAFES